MCSYENIEQIIQNERPIHVLHITSKTIYVYILSNEHQTDLKSKVFIV